MAAVKCSGCESREVVFTRRHRGELLYQLCAACKEENDRLLADGLKRQRERNEEHDNQ